VDYNLEPVTDEKLTTEEDWVMSQINTTYSRSLEFNNTSRRDKWNDTMDKATSGQGNEEDWYKDGWMMLRYRQQVMTLNPFVTTSGCSSRTED